MKLLVVKPDHLGDFALALPALWEAVKAVGNPQNVTVLASHANTTWSKILPWLPNIRAIEHPKYVRGDDRSFESSIQLGVESVLFSRLLKSQAWDWGIELTSSRHDFLGKLLLVSAGCQKRRGAEGHWDFLLHEACGESQGHQSRWLADRFPKQLNCTGTSDPKDFIPPTFRWSPSSTGSILLSPWAGTPAKSWSWDSWSELISKLRLEGIPLQLMIPVDVAAEGARFAAQCGIAKSEIRTLNNLTDTLLALRTARALVGLDTAVAHFAWLVGTPLVQLFSGTASSARWGALGKVTRFDYPPACSPCRLEQCAQESHLCMDAITPEAVFEGIRAV